MSLNSKYVKVAVGAGLGYLAYKQVDARHQISKDVEFVRRYIPAIRTLNKVESERPQATIADFWEETVDKHPNKVALVFTEDGRKFTFKDIDERANQIAQWAIQRGLKAGDVVALFVENRPEFLFVQLGLAKAGVIVALINTNNKSKPLSHSIEVALAKMIIFGTELNENMSTVADEIKGKGISLFSIIDPANPEQPTFDCESLDSQIEGLSKERPPLNTRNGCDFNGTFGYIYTSGTTGLPKACVIKHRKFFSTAVGLPSIYKVDSTDVWYTVLPLYHSAGGMIGLGALYCGGLTMVLARKFSARKFFKDCAENEVTVTQYIGELARYLLNSEPTEWENKHKVRVAIGNGMRKENWIPFLERFNIQEMGEFYGSTEGNVALANHSINRQGVGACGHAGTLLQKILKFQVVKHDVATEVPLRDSKTGFCIPCKRGEVGELLGLIDTSNNKSTEFVGYTSKEASNKKILKDVFVKGDAYFRTGDLIRHDSDGWIFFSDRIGDTFRWKGENVSTGEVSSIVSMLPGVLEANIYGVKVPGNEDGRACMAAIVTEGQAIPDFKQVLTFLKQNLASYALPQFIRIIPEMQSTGTFKQRKVDFVKDGCDPALIQDPLFVIDGDTYVELDAGKYLSIAQGKARL